MADPLVSVVIPTYNRAARVGRAVDSALGQTHRSVEVLVVDDGSTDGTAELLARRYGAEPRVRVLVQENRGVAGARNAGLREVRGAFVALLDSDDLWLPWKLEAQLACLAALPSAGMIWTDMDAVSPEGDVIAPRFLTTMYDAYRWFSRDELFESSRPLSAIAPALAAPLGDPAVYLGDVFSEMILGNLVHTSTVLLRRERLERVGGFDEGLRTSGEDHDFHLRTCREGPVAYLDVPSIHYLRGAADQLTAGDANMLAAAENFLRTVGRTIERDGERIRLPRVVIEDVLAEAHEWIGSVHAERGETLAAARHLARSLRPGHAARLGGLVALSLLPRPAARTLRRLWRRARGRDAPPPWKETRA